MYLHWKFYLFSFILLTWRIWWAPNKAADGRWDLTRRLKDYAPLKADVTRLVSANWELGYMFRVGHVEWQANYNGTQVCQLKDVSAAEDKDLRLWQQRL